MCLVQIIFQNLHQHKTCGTDEHIKGIITSSSVKSAMWHQSKCLVAGKAFRHWKKRKEKKRKEKKRKEKKEGRKKERGKQL
jgi:hypothetical protein